MKSLIVIRMMVCVLLVFLVLQDVHAETGGIIKESGVRGGLVVHIGCGNGRETAKLYLNDSFLVQGLDTNASNVMKARKHIKSLGLYHRVTANTFNHTNLPYVDGLVNLIVIQDAKYKIPDKEIKRVLAPGGVAVGPKGSHIPQPARRMGKGFTKFTKPVPSNIDDWSHHFQGADNNAVANDTIVDTPRRLKWTCGPLWSRSHEFLSSISAMISAEGRLFYIVDEGLPGTTDHPVPERWMLLARDAFNGVLLWKKPLKDWGTLLWKKAGLRATPGWAPKRIVAGNGRLFMMMGASGKVSAFDVATGELLMTYKGTEKTREMLYLDHILVVQKGKNRILAIDADTGKPAWEVQGKIQPVIAASDEKVYFFDNSELVCCDLKTGKIRWQTKTLQKVIRIVIGENTIVLANNKQLQARETDTGKERWTHKGRMKKTLFIANNRVWTGLHSYDLETGKAMPVIDASDVHTPGHHARCYPGKATVNYFITPNRGTEFVSLTHGKNTQNDWTRGPCTFGILPCNGLLYVPPNPCFCYTGVKITGFNAYMGKGKPAQYKGRRLLKGPAYSEGRKQKPTNSDGDWVTYRGNAQRTGHSGAKVGTRLKKTWSIKLEGRLTQPIIADGRVYVVSKDTHTLHVLKERSGKEIWTYTAGGRIDSPPTVYNGLVLFGSVDGNVYCLSAENGALVWKFMAAPSAQQIVAFNQLESPWRVHGSILVIKGVAYFTAGRSTYLDGGILVYGLDPGTGKVLHETKLDTWSRTRADAVGKPFIPGYHMEGAVSDILVSEEDAIYLGQYKLSLELKEQEVPYLGFEPEVSEGAMGMEELIDKPYTEGIRTQSKYETIQRDWQPRKWPKMSEEYKKKYGGLSMGQRKFGRHVFATGGFLDDTYFNRTFWMYSGTWPGFTIANRAAKTGQILSVDKKKTYAVQAFPRRNLQSPLFTPGRKGYLLFADDNENEPIIPAYSRDAPKGIGFTRKNPPAWFQWINIRVRAMVSAGNALFIAGPPDILDQQDPMASFDGKAGGLLRAVSKETGEKISQIKLDAPPIFDGMSVKDGKLFVATTDGKITCYGRIE